MDKIYSRPRIRIPKIVFQNKFRKRGYSFNKNKNARKVMKIVLILVIAFSTAKMILDAVIPIFTNLCENKAKSIATIVSNEQASNVMKEHNYDELFSIERDNNGNIEMIKSNVIPINEIISDVANKIQKEIDNKGKDNVSIAIRKFYRNEITFRKRPTV